MKYKGKYKKCRDCKHVKEIWNVIVEINRSCKNDIANRLGYSTKDNCERCEQFESWGEA